MLTDRVVDDNSESQGGGKIDQTAQIVGEDTAREDVPGGPAWPGSAGRPAVVPAPPVGLNWSSVADYYGLDAVTLRHDGSIVLAGEYFPAPGYFIDPGDFTGRRVDVGGMALRHGYLIGEIPKQEFEERLTVSEETGSVPVATAATGPVIGLFASEDDAARVRTQILQGSLGSGVVIQHGPLGAEVHVRQTELPGRVATVICATGGAVIGVSGQPVTTGRSHGVSATGGSGTEDDAPRGGIGAISDTEA